MTISEPASHNPGARLATETAVALPATCGELVQGTLDGVPCLVSCPIGWYGSAHVSLCAGDAPVRPTETYKAHAAARAVLQLHQVHGQSVHLRLYSEIPRGRGYGSSTVDVGACLYAVSRALGRELEPGEAARLAVAIEPTDSTLFPGLTLFDHRRGSFSRFLGGAPALDVVVIDPGGYVDTVAFNRRDLRQALQRLTETHREAFELLGHGLASGDAPAIGQAATLSARAHQSILHNPLLEDVLRLAREIDALGVCRAHSGTILGVLLDRSNTDLAACSRFLRRRLPTGVEISSYPLVDGGPRILRTDSILENRQHS